MGFKFTHLCDLLSALENNRILKATNEAKTTDPDVKTVTHWFKQHGTRLRDKDTDKLAVLSCMFPEKRTDRVYWLQDTSLARVIGRCLLLGSSRREELERWRLAGGPDLAKCVENVMRQAENQVIEGQEVTVEEIDTAMNAIASRCRFSGPRVRRHRGAVDVDRALSPLYRRLSSRDAKWLTRMILKSYLPVVVPQALVLRSIHFLLPRLLLFQDSFEGALSMLASEPIAHFPPHPEPGLAKDLGTIALQHLKPVVGVKIGRPDFYKARSIKHCCQMIGQRRMSIERKYDGEYCQIHVELTRTPSVQIFSKSGKDATADRSGVIPVIKDALRIGHPDCVFSRQCILEAEILVWSDKHGRIMDFHKLRKFIARSGMYIGTENDSPPQVHEHLMIVFFDILLLDDNACLKKPHRERRLLLKHAVQVTPGQADIAYQRILDFSRPNSVSHLESIFTHATSSRWEGLVLKSSEDPYFPILSHTHSGQIKLKKDYIPGLGDTVDLTILAGRHDSRAATEATQIKNLHWTHFFVACLTNKEAVVQRHSTPRFRVVDVLTRHSMSAKNMQILNQFGQYTACAVASAGFEIEYGRGNIPALDVVFKSPFIVEMLGSGFEKPSGAAYFTLRFPRIVKIHWDRSFRDAASFTELQVLAGDARAVQVDSLDSTRSSKEPIESSSKRRKPNIPIYVDETTPSPSSTNTNTNTNLLKDTSNIQPQEQPKCTKTPSLHISHLPCTNQIPHPLPSPDVDADPETPNPSRTRELPKSRTPPEIFNKIPIQKYTPNQPLQLLPRLTESQNTGILLLSPDTNPLGPALLNITRSLSGVSRSGYTGPKDGRLFVFDEGVVGSGEGLRGFYACVSWDSSSSLLSVDGERDSMCVDGEGPGCGEMRVRVGFGKGELDYLNTIV